MGRDLWRRCSAVLCACVALLSGCGGGADGSGAAPPAAPDDGAPPQVLQAVGTITLDVARSEQGPPNANGRIVLEWSTTGEAASFTAWLSPREGQPFVEVAADVTDNRAVFHPGPSWKLDFPTALVRVRGCDASGDNCADSNALPLAEALVEARPSLIPSVEPQHVDRRRQQLVRDRRRRHADRCAARHRRRHVRQPGGELQPGTRRPLQQPGRPVTAVRHPDARLPLDDGSGGTQRRWQHAGHTAAVQLRRRQLAGGHGWRRGGVHQRDQHDRGGWPLVAAASGDRCTAEPRQWSKGSASASPSATMAVAWPPPRPPAASGRARTRCWCSTSRPTAHGNSWRRFRAPRTTAWR